MLPLATSKLEKKSHGSVYICLNSPYCNWGTSSILASFQKLQVFYWIQTLQQQRLRERSCLLNASFTRSKELGSERESLLPSLSCSSTLGLPSAYWTTRLLRLGRKVSSALLIAASQLTIYWAKNRFNRFVSSLLKRKLEFFKNTFSFKKKKHAVVGTTMHSMGFQ